MIVGTTRQRMSITPTDEDSTGPSAPYVGSYYARVESTWGGVMIDRHVLNAWFAVVRARIQGYAITDDDRAYQVALFYRRLFK